jgi:hypothetical protein
MNIVKENLVHSYIHHASMQRIRATALKFEVLHEMSYNNKLEIYMLKFSLLQIVQTGSEVHPTFCPMGTWGSFPGGKAAGW